MGDDSALRGYIPFFAEADGFSSSANLETSDWLIASRNLRVAVSRAITYSVSVTFDVANLLEKKSVIEEIMSYIRHTVSFPHY